MNTEINALKTRLEGVVSQQGTFIANLGVNATKTTTEGELGVTAGAIAILNDFDDIPDGSTNIVVAGVSVGNQVQAASIATDAVEEAKIKDDAVTNAKIGALAVDTAELAAGAVEDAKVASDADIASGKILISGGTRLDDWRDSGDVTKIAAAELAGDTPDALDIATTNPQPAGFVRAGAVRAMNAVDPDGISIAGNIVHQLTGADDGASVTGCDISATTIDAGETGGGGTGEGGDPVEP